MAGTPRDTDVFVCAKKRDMCEASLRMASWVKRCSYCSVSIKRVIVRFRSLSDRRISSILLIECSTVV